MALIRASSFFIFSPKTRPIMRTNLRRFEVYVVVCDSMHNRNCVYCVQFSGYKDCDQSAQQAAQLAGRQALMDYEGFIRQIPHFLSNFRR